MLALQGEPPRRGDVAMEWPEKVFPCQTFLPHPGSHSGISSSWHNTPGSDHALLTPATSLNPRQLSWKFPAGICPFPPLQGSSSPAAPAAAQLCNDSVALPLREAKAGEVQGVQALLRSVSISGWCC